MQWLVAAAAIVSLAQAPAPQPKPAPPPTAAELRARIADSRAHMARARERLEQLSKETGIPVDKHKAFDVFIETDLDKASPEDRRRALNAYRMWEELVSLTSQEIALKGFEQQLEQTDDIMEQIAESEGLPDRAPTDIAQDWGALSPGSQSRTITVSNGCGEAKRVAIRHNVPHLTVPAFVVVPPGESNITFAFSIPASATGTVEGTIALAFPGDARCEPRTSVYVISATIRRDPPGR